MENKNENVHKERRITKRTKIRRVIIRDNKIFCQNILQNLIKIFREVNKFEAFKKAILVRFDF